MIQYSIYKKGLALLCLGLSTGAFAQSSLKFESAGGPTGNGPNTSSKTVTMYNGDGAVYSPTTTVTYSLSNQQYPSIEGNPGVPGILFGGTSNGGGNAPAALPFYELLNAIGSSTNTMYSTGGVNPAINIANDYGVSMFLCTDALINADGSNKVSTNTKDILFGRLTLTFNRPVTNPVIHLTGLGGRATIILPNVNSDLGISPSFRITGGQTITRLAGNSFFDIAGGEISNSAATYTASSANTSAPAGASGSFRVNGTSITTVALDVYMNGDGAGSIWSNTGVAAGDAFLVSVSLAAYDISGTVFNDNNAGTPNGAVPPGTTVTLYAANGTTVIATTTTNASGNYSFPDQLPGNYIVGVTPPSGYQHVSSTDATPTNGRTSVTLGSANATGVNFGINQPPTANNDAISNQVPGSPATVSNILSNDSDPNSGTLSAGRISLVTPSGATNATNDGNGHVTGFTVPGQGVWALNNSTGAVTFTPEAGFTGDPTAIHYTVTDAAGLTSAQATISIDYNPPVTLSGTLFNDNNGTTGGANGTPLSGVTVTLYAADGTTVIATTTTDASGNYSFPNRVPGSYIVGVTTPAGYQNVSSTDATPANGRTSVTVGSTAVSGVNFGMNQPPAATNDNLVNQTAGTPATVPNLLGNDTDPNSGSLSAGNISLETPSGATNPTTDPNGHVTGFTVPGQGTWTLNSSTGTVTFTPQVGFTGDPTPINYTVTDAAGLTSAQATVSIDYNNAALSGNVFNDANGGAIDGTPTNAGGTLNALLVDESGNVVASVAVSASGQYNFDNVPSGNYRLRLSNTAGTPGQPAPAASLPVGWSNTAEGTTASGDGTADGSISIIVGTATLSNLNFGIERLPESYPVTETQTGMPAVTNLGSNPLQGSDAEDQVSQGSWAGKTLVIDTLPTNGYILKYNGVTVTAGTQISNYDPALLSIEPGPGSAGTATSTFKYSTIDAAGKKDPSPAAYTVNWSTVLPVELIAFRIDRIKDCHALLYWETGTESSAAYFEIGHSTDARTFAPVGSVRTKGSGSVYQYEAKLVNGTNYFRLKTVNDDQSYKLSGVVFSQTDCNGAGQIRVYPTIVSNQLTIEGLEQGAIVQVFDMSGKQVYKARAASTIHYVAVQQYASGVYTIVITTDGSEMIMERFSKP